jgi:hypothetical protein
MNAPNSKIRLINKQDDIRNIIWSHTLIRLTFLDVYTGVVNDKIWNDVRKPVFNRVVVGAFYVLDENLENE